jgi:hypothetical protein
MTNTHENRIVCQNTWPSHLAVPQFKVSYLHLQGYRVSRTFNSRQAAQDFIDVNALVCPLPGCRGVEPI